MDKLTAIKIKYDDGTYSDEIPISVLAENVEWDSTHTLVDILGSVDIDVTGTIQDQISQLFNEKVSNYDMQNYISSSMPTYITNWLNTNVNPVGSAVVVDSSLTISGAAADAKVTGDNITDLKSALLCSFEEQDDVTFSKGTIDATGVVASANNGVYTTNLLSDIELIIASAGCRFTLYLYDQNSSYIGKINSSGALDKVGGDWKYYTGFTNVKNVQEKYSAKFIRICITPTDGTTISGDTAQTYGDAHSDFYKLIINAD